jgi:nucleotide-binding universal stress UspA family protein
MKAILIPVEDHATMTNVMETALLLARRFNGYIEGVALGPDVSEMVAADFSLSGVIFDERTRREFLDHARDAFSNFMQANTITDSQTISWTWAGDTLMSDTGVGEYGRLFDVIVVGRPGAAATEPRRTTLEGALFESGRPVLIVPPRTPTTLGKRIAIAWNGGAETARTTTFALPLLRQAEDIVVLDTPANRLPGPSAEQFTESLRRHDLPVRFVPVKAGARTPGAAILDGAQDIGADLLIKGGYAQSRWRQIIFGSVTTQILTESTLPVLMAY